MNSKNVVSRFRQAGLVKRVAARFAMDHSSPEAMKKYLHEHPNADPSDHHVEKKEDKKPAAEKASLEADHVKAQTRSQAVTKAYDTMKDLKKKVENADPTAKKRFNTAYDKIFEQGEAASKHAEKLLKKVKTKSGTQESAAAHVLANAMDDWHYNQLRHHKAQGATTGGKLQQAEESWAFAKSIDDAITDLHKALKGDFD